MEPIPTEHNFGIHLKKNIMSFTGNENHSISLYDAAGLTKNFRDSQSGIYIKGEFFGKDAINSVIQQEGCVGIRIYNGLDDNSVQKLVIIGVTSDENDMTDGNILEYGIPCPTICGISNELNSDV